MARFAVPKSAEPLVADPKTFTMSAEWYRFFDQVAKALGGDTALSEIVTVTEETAAAAEIAASAGGSEASGSDLYQRVEDLSSDVAHGLAQIEAVRAEATEALAAAVGSLAPISNTDALELARSRGWRIEAAGSATLVAGAATVTTELVTANSLVLLTVQASGGTPGLLSIGTVTPGTSFAIASANGADTSTVAWFLFEPTGD
jgi:hypothetical protein